MASEAVFDRYLHERVVHLRRLLLPETQRDPPKNLHQRRFCHRDYCRDGAPARGGDCGGQQRQVRRRLHRAHWPVLHPHSERSGTRRTCLRVLAVSEGVLATALFRSTHVSTPRLVQCPPMQ